MFGVCTLLRGLVKIYQMGLLPWIWLVCYCWVSDCELG